MRNLEQKLYFFLLSFFVVNVIQALLTPISQDEAYYWMYAQNLDWGFFDHPPMIAVCVKIGGLLVPGVMGVRLMTTILSTLTLWITWTLIPKGVQMKKNAMALFFVLAFSLPIFNIYGFITTPDVPLLLFSALYLKQYISFLQKNTLLNALKLGLLAALLMYSKYHGAFVIIFSILANIKLLWNRNFYLAGLTGILLYFPHLLWQYEHDFISLRYHLIQRSDGFMGGKNIVDYIMNAFVILNPFILAVFLRFLFKEKKDPDVPRVFYFEFWGFLGFFAFTSLRDHIEPQWIGVASIPMLVILHNFLLRTEALPKYIRPILIGSLALILLLRIGLVLPLPVNSEFHKHKASFYETIRQKSNGKPVVFINTYYNAAKYTFYTGEPAFSYNCYDYRKNQYDLWDYETSYHMKPAYFLSGYPYPWITTTMELEGRKYYTDHIDSFPMINKVEAEWIQAENNLGKDKMQHIQFSLLNPYEYPLVFNDENIPLKFYVVFQLGLHRIVVPMDTDIQAVVEPGEAIILNGTYVAEVPTDKYQLAVGLQPLNVSPVLITEKMNVEVR